MAEIPAPSSPIKVREEIDTLAKVLPNAPIRAFGSLTGHSLEAQFPLGIALAALAIKKQGFYAPFEDAEKPAAHTPESIVVTSLGHWRSEGVGLVTKVDE